MPFSDFTNNNNDDNDPKGNAHDPNDRSIASALHQAFTQAMMPDGSDEEDPHEAVRELLTNYNEKYKNANPAQYRDRVIDNTTACLISKMKPNALLTGPAGGGKTRIVEEIARRIANNDPSVPTQLRDYTIYELPLSALVAGSGIVGQLESKIQAVIDMFSDDDEKAILFIDEIHMLVDDSQSHTYGKIAQILKPALARGDIRLIGATTTQEAITLDSDPAFKRRFTHVMVSEFTQSQTEDIIAMAISSYEDHYDGRITVDPALAGTLVTTADNYLPSTLHRPDNALTLLDRSMAAEAIQLHALIKDGIAPPTASAKVTEHRIITTAESIATSDAARPQIDFAAMADDLAQLIAQDEQTKRIHAIMRRHHRQALNRRKPLSLLFPGASGVGKTETAKIISRHLTGLEPIRLNMNEYSQQHDLTKVTGSTDGYIGSDSKRELPLDPLRSNPYRVVLLDEIEKAHRSIQHLFLTALDEGYISLSRGDRIDMRKTIIIATTNAARDVAGNNEPESGFAVLSTATNTNTNNRQNRLTLMSRLERHFSAEFLGRFDHIIAFNKLDRNDFCTIVRQEYDQLRRKAITQMPYNKNKLPRQIPDEVVDYITDEFYVSKLGARPARTAVSELIDEILDPYETADTNDRVALIEQQQYHQQCQPVQQTLFDI